MKTANHTIVSYVLYLIGITVSLMALKGINQYFSTLTRLTKTKFPTLVTPIQMNLMDRVFLVQLNITR